MKTEFVATVAQEFRTPLTAIWEFCELLPNREALSPDQRQEFLNHIYQRSVGLGMCIVKQIVEAFGGEIRVGSALGQGTTFSITQPVAAPPLLGR